MSGINPTEATVGGLQTLLPTSSVEEVSPGISSWIIFASVGVGGLVVLLIITALIIISVVVCLKKRKKDHHINNTECNCSNTKSEKAYLMLYEYLNAMLSRSHFVSHQKLYSM